MPYDDTELDFEEQETADAELFTADPVDAQIALVMLSASELAKHTPVTELMPQIEGGLGALYGQAQASGDVVALAHIESAWQSVQLVAQQAHGNAETLAASIAALGTLKKQRDQAHLTIGDLSTQVASLAEEIDYIQESAYGDFMQGIYDNGGHVFETPDENIWEGIYDNVVGLEEDMMPTADQCGQFFEYLVSCPCNLDEALELVAFIKAFTTKVEARRKADHEAWIAQHNAKVAAARGGAS
jgi:hypothetical protein